MKLTSFSLCVFISIQSVCSWASADPDANAEALAESLYREGKRLMTEGQAAAACPKFAESFRLSPAAGTQLNLAACYQESGKWASAWTAYQAAIAAAARDGRKDRVEYAQARIAEIEPMLSYVTLHIIGEERPEKLEVSIDDVKVSLQAIGIALPIDPGAHVVAARAEGYQNWESPLNVNEEKARLTLEIPPLKPVVSEPETISTAPPPAKEEKTSAPPPAAIKDGGTSRPVPTSIFVAGGITAAAGIGAIVAGALYLSESDKADTASSQQNENEYNDHSGHAQTMSNLNLGLGITFGLGVVTTAVLYLTRPEVKTTSSNSSAWTNVVPWATRHGAGVAFTFQGDLSAPAGWELP